MIEALHNCQTIAALDSLLSLSRLVFIFSRTSSSCIDDSFSQIQSLLIMHASTGIKKILQIEL